MKALTKILYFIIVYLFVFSLLFHGKIYSQKLQWEANYHFNNNTSGISVKTDNTGNVFVLGGSGNSSIMTQDFILIKYDSQGTILWANTYNGSGDGDDNAADLFIDIYGNSFVTGRSVNEKNEYEAVIIKYNSEGVEQWVSKYTEPGYFCVPKSVTVDKTGNIYITGFIKDYNGSEYNSYFTVKYNSAGNEMWSVKNTFGTNDREEPIGIKTDFTGNVYIAGWIGNVKASSEDFLTAKFNPGGELLWSKTYDGRGNGNNRLMAFDVDGSGNIYVTGYTKNESNKSDYTTIKYNTDGIIMWSKNYNSGIGSAYPLDLKIDNSGCIIITGGAWIGNVNYNDFATIKYDSSGNQLWTKIFNVPGSYEEANSIAIDNNNNIYISGGNTTNDYIIAKYNSEGVELWSSKYDRSGETDRPSSIAVNSNGDLYITGFSSNGSNRDITTLKYTSFSDTSKVNLFINKQ